MLLIKSSLQLLGRINKKKFERYIIEQRKHQIYFNTPIAKKG